jgi:hypothetical protein
VIDRDDVAAAGPLERDVYALAGALVATVGSTGRFSCDATQYSAPRT